MRTDRRRILPPAAEYGTISTSFLVLTNIQPAEWAYQLSRRPMIIGRASDADIRIPSRYAHVSRRHAEISHKGPGYVIRDLKSLAGTRVNGVWVDNGRAVRIAIGDHIWLGNVEIKLIAEIPHYMPPGSSEIPPEEPETDSVLDSLEAEPEEFPDPETCLRSRSVHERSRHLLERLTHAEFEVLLWICRGHFSDISLSRLLGCSPHTVRTHVGKVLQKLELHSRAELIGWFEKSLHLADRFVLESFPELGQEPFVNG